MTWEPDSTDFNSKSFLFAIFQDKKQNKQKQQQQWNSNIHFSQSGTQEWVQASGTGRSPNRARGQLHRLESRRHYTHAKGNNLTQNRKRVTAMLQTHREISTRATYFQRRNQICGKLTAMPERKKKKKREKEVSGRFRLLLGALSLFYLGNCTIHEIFITIFFFPLRWTLEVALSEGCTCSYTVKSNSWYLQDE